MESCRDVKQKSADEYIREIISIIKPINEPINEEGAELNPLQKAVYNFLDHIIYIMNAAVKEGITIEKDLNVVLMLLQTYHSQDDTCLSNISQLNARILQNKGAESRRTTGGATAAVVGGVGLGVMGAMVFFPPAAAMGLMAYLGVGGASAIAGACGAAVPTGVAIVKDTKNKRGELVKCEQELLDTILDQFKKGDYKFFAQTHLSVIKQNATAANEQRDSIIDFTIDKINNTATHQQILDQLELLRINLEGNSQSNAAEVTSVLKLKTSIEDSMKPKVTMSLVI